MRRAYEAQIVPQRKGESEELYRACRPESRGETVAACLRVTASAKGQRRSRTGQPVTSVSGASAFSELTRKRDASGVRSYWKYPNQGVNTRV